MSSSDRRRLCLALGLLAGAGLAGCGFAPAYAPGGPGTLLRDQVLVAAPVNRDGFVFVARMEERLGRGGAERFDLSYDIGVAGRGTAVTGSNDITRVNLTGTVTYRLIERASGAQLRVGRLDSFTSYSTTGSTIATAAAERDARDRLMVALADRVVSDLLANAGRFP